MWRENIQDEKVNSGKRGVEKRDRMEEEVDRGERQEAEEVSELNEKDRQLLVVHRVGERHMNPYTHCMLPHASHALQAMLGVYVRM